MFDTAAIPARLRPEAKALLKTLGEEFKPRTKAELLKIAVAY
jgi:hypothetical protein